MNAVRLAVFEFRRQKRPLQIVAVVFLMLIPLLYGALYLWSAWDPYGQLDRLPVAVVDQDRPVTVDGKQIAAGQEFVSRIENDPIFDWSVTDASSAATGLADGKYLIVVTIPSTFSADLASGNQGTARKAQVQMRVDDSNGYLVNIIAETARAKLNQRVDQAATTAYFESVYGKLDTLRAGLATADAGSARLESGLKQAATGTTTLVTGLTKLDAGATRLVTGATTLESGAKQVAAGNERIASLAVPVLDDVSDALPGLATRTTRLTDDVATLTSLVSAGTNDLRDRQARLESALAKLAAENPDAAKSPEYLALSGAVDAVGRGIEDAATTTSTVAAGVGAVDTAAQDASRDVPELQRTLRQGATDVTRLATGAREVADGAARLRAGAVELDTGLDSALTGAKKLETGAAELSSGATELHTGLDRMVAAVPALSPEERKQNAEILGSPAEVTLVADNPAGVYGRGLAPFFFAIALWVVGLAAFLILRPVNSRALAVRGARSLTVSLGGWFPVMVVGIVGGLILLTVTTVGLGLDPVHLTWTVGLVALAAACFTSIAHVLRLTWGVVGSAVALVLLMLQLTSCGGIYPVETLPEPLRLIHPLLPMTYLVEGLRVTFTGGPVDRLWTDVAVLVAYALAAVLAAWYVVHRKRRWTPGRRDPALPE